MNRYCLLLAAVAAASVVACTTVDQPQTTSATSSGDEKAEKVYATGSRIPVRDSSSGSASVRSVNNRGATEMLDKGQVTLPAKNGPQ